MKILIIAFWFPPANMIGAIRVGKLARFLDRRGHDVRVLTSGSGEDQSLPIEIPRERVICTGYPEHEDPLKKSVGSLLWRRAAALGNNITPTPTNDRTATRRLWQGVRRQYFGLIHIPDTRASWIKTAIPAGRRLIEQWRPDIIFASAPPYTGLVIANRLARALNIAWVADLRDLWVDNVYYGEPIWRRPLDAVLEMVTLRGAARLVTVSPIWAQQLCRRHGKVVDVIYNGYAEEDFPPPPKRSEPGDILKIRYLGSIYQGFRDPSPLFSAIARLPQTLRHRVRVEFYGDDCDLVLAAAAARAVGDAVAAWPRVSYRRALELQTDSDVLLLLQSTGKRDEGNLPAKLFEYLYARRPILLIGYERGIAAELVVQRGAGLVSSDPAQISDQLQSWIAAKQAGSLGRLDPSVSRGLSRDEQYAKLEELFREILCAGSCDSPQVSGLKRSGIRAPSRIA